MSMASLHLRAVTESGLALQVLLASRNTHNCGGCYCWYILVRPAALTAGRVVRVVAFCAAGRSAFMIVAILHGIEELGLLLLSGVKASEVKFRICRKESDVH